MYQTLKHLVLEFVSRLQARDDVNWTTTTTPASSLGLQPPTRTSDTWIPYQASSRQLITQPSTKPGTSNPFAPRRPNSSMISDSKLTNPHMHPTNLHTLSLLPLLRLPPGPPLHHRQHPVLSGSLTTIHGHAHSHCVQPLYRYHTPKQQRQPHHNFGFSQEPQVVPIASG